MSDGTWHQVASVDDVQPDEPIKVDIGEDEVALYNVDGEIFATANICTHAFASLADGFQEGEQIECPLHDGRFNVKTGKALCPPVEGDLKTYETKVEDGAIFVKA
ncbi:MAG: non-heme iron oxygenase ferredoxin subunit [Proteobacteria bacterium]|nr:non-heme iron oxygenase ferredoxin subunit [Pseudomonadota bacterium]